VMWYQYLRTFFNPHTVCQRPRRPLALSRPPLRSLLAMRRPMESAHRIGRWTVKFVADAVSIWFVGLLSLLIVVY
jgi:hypothetical protein